MIRPFRDFRTIARDRCAACLGVLSPLLLVAEPASAQSVVLEPLIVEPFEVPGLGTPQVLIEGRLSNDDEVLLRGLLPNSIDSLFRIHGEAISIIAVENDPAPGGPPGAEFSGNFAEFRLPAQNQTVFAADLDGPGFVQVDSLWWTAGATLVNIGFEQEQAAGLPEGVLYSQIDQDFAANALGQVVFMGRIEGPGVNLGNRFGIWRWQGATPELLVRASDPAPDTASTFTSFQAVAINDLGEIVFAASIDQVNDSDGVWAGVPGRFAAVAVDGQPVPGQPEGIVYGDVGFFAFTSNALILSATLEGPGIDSGNDRLIARRTGGDLTILAREGDPAPGFPDGVTLAGLDLADSAPDGSIAFRGTVAGEGIDSGNDQALWLETERGFSMIMREGDGAPGTDELAFAYSPTTSVNSQGQAVFEALLEPEGSGVWAWCPQAGLLPVAVPGQMIEVAPDDIREVTGAELWEDAPWASDALNEAGRFIVHVEFGSDLDGAFLGSMPAAGDVTGDGVVNVEDLVATVLAWGPCPVPPETCPADLDGDQVVDVQDLIVVILNWS